LSPSPFTTQYLVAYYPVPLFTHPSFLTSSSLLQIIVTLRILYSQLNL
jgi:hypothetical protein